MQLHFDTNGNEKQKQAATYWNDDITTDVGYGGGKYGGKSFLGCSLIFADALTFPGTHYAIGRVELTDLFKFTYPSIMEVLTAWGVGSQYWKYNGQYNFFELYNGSRVYFVPVKYLPSDPDYQRFGSMQFTRVWGEEIGEWHIKAKANFHITVGRWRNEEYNLLGKGLYTFNPSRNFTYAQYYKLAKEGTLPDYRKFIKALSNDNKVANPAVIKNMIDSLTPSDYRRLVLGEWEVSDDPDNLVTYDAVCDAFTNAHVVAPDSFAERSLSTDLAMKGRDKWIAFSWRGNVATLAINEPYSEGPEMIERIESLMATESIPRSRVVSDADGLGAFLETFIKGINEFHNNGRAFDYEHYANLKSECGWLLAKMINERTIRIVCDSLIAEDIKDELMMLKSESIASDASKRRLISKDRMKELLGRSPDFLDALLMKMIFNLKPLSRGVKNWGVI